MELVILALLTDMGTAAMEQPMSKDWQSENKCFTEMCRVSEEGSYLRLMDFCITHL